MEVTPADPFKVQVLHLPGNGVIANGQLGEKCGGVSYVSYVRQGLCVNIFAACTQLQGPLELAALEVKRTRLTARDHFSMKVRSGHQLIGGVLRPATK